MRVKSEERRQTILNIAKQLFIERGFENTSMSEISSRVGGSKATLYNYFASKEEMFVAVMESFGEEKIANAFLSMDPDADIRSELQQMGYHYLSFILEPEVMAIRIMALHEASRSDIGRQFYAQGPEKGWRLIQEYLAGQGEKQRLQIPDPQSCAMHLKGLLEAEVVEPYALGVIPVPEPELLRQVVARAVSAFLAIYGR